MTPILQDHRPLSADAVGAMGLGCMGMSEFYGPLDDVRSTAVIHAALDAGVRLLDTADMYGEGHNEELIGRALRARRDQAFVATKFGVRRDGANRWTDASPAYARAACDASLRRLGIETIDLYYLHRLDPAVPVEDTVGALAELVQAGKVRRIGLSEVSAKTLHRAAAVHPIAAVQSEFSLWTRDVVTDGVLAAARELGTALVAYAPLGRGFLTGTVRSLERLAADDFRRDCPRFAATNLNVNARLLDVLRSVADQQTATLGQTALAWVLAQGSDVIPIPGTKRMTYLQENLGAATLTLLPAQLATLEAAFSPDRVAGDRYPAASLPDTRSIPEGASR